MNFQFNLAGDRIVKLHFVSLSVRQSVRHSVTFRIRAITYVCIDGLPSYLIQMLSSLRWCAVDPYLKGQGHTRHLKVRVHMLVSALELTYALMNYHLTWHKCCPHWDDVQWSCIIIMCSKFNILINNGHKCDTIFITCIFSSKAVKQCYDVTSIYMYDWIENTYLHYTQSE